MGILVLNYHHPVETLDCVQRLISQEPTNTRVLWVENDTEATREKDLAVLRGSGLPSQRATTPFDRYPGSVNSSTPRDRNVTSPGHRSQGCNARGSASA